MSDPSATDVDEYIVERLVGADRIAVALKANAAAGLPAIDVSPAQGKFLHLLARITGARRILEVGTLGGYSTIWLARALQDGGRLVTLEIDPHHADVARRNIADAGLADRVEIRVGPAAETLAAMEHSGAEPFDLVFIDADKPSNPIYLRHALALTRPGSVIIVDNVVRGGRVLDAASPDAAVQGTRALFDAVAAEPRLDATALQTVGLKGWDGFVIALVKN